MHKLYDTQVILLYILAKKINENCFFTRPCQTQCSCSFIISSRKKIDDKFFIKRLLFPLGHFVTITINHVICLKSVLIGTFLNLYYRINISRIITVPYTYARVRELQFVFVFYYFLIQIAIQTEITINLYCVFIVNSVITYLTLVYFHPTSGPTYYETSLRIQRNFLRGKKMNKNDRFKYTPFRITRHSIFRTKSNYVS